MIEVSQPLIIDNDNKYNNNNNKDKFVHVIQPHLYGHGQFHFTESLSL